MTRIRFEDLPSTNTPRNAENLNKLNNVEISPTEPETGEEVWIQKGKNLFDTRLLVQGGWNNSDNSERVVWGIKVKAGVKYTISNYSQKRISVFETTNLIQSNSNNSVLVEHGSLNGVGNMTITVVNDAYLRLLFSNLDNSSISVSDILPSDVQVELGDISTNFEPFTPNKIYIKNGNGVYEEFYSEENKQLKVLWTNPNPTSNFASSTINLSSSNYDYLLINFLSNTTGGEGSSIIIKKGQNSNLRYLTYTRKVTYNNGTSISFGDGYLDNSVRNWLNVPIEIVGIKL